jgi:hypothetical protein
VDAMPMTRRDALASRSARVRCARCSVIKASPPRGNAAAFRCPPRCEGPPSLMIEIRRCPRRRFIIQIPGNRHPINASRRELHNPGGNVADALHREPAASSQWGAASASSLSRSRRRFRMAMPLPKMQNERTRGGPDRNSGGVEVAQLCQDFGWQVNCHMLLNDHRPISRSRRRGACAP